MAPTQTIKITPEAGNRSNRPLSQWACTQLGFFTTGHYQGTGQRTKGNTTVVYEVDDFVQSFRVLLFGEEILSVLMHDWKFFSVRVSFTTFFDGYGQPTLTTCERLNSLLDRLGAYQVIPPGVRIFKDHAANLTYLGRLDDKVAVGEGLANSVYIRPDPQVLDIVGTELVHELLPHVI